MKRARTVDRLQRRAAARRGMLSLAGGLPSPALFPRRVIAAASVSALEKAGCSALQYGWPEGAPELRQWVARRLRSRGARITAEDVIITSGAQQAIALAVDVLLEKGERIAVDDESYPAALELFRARGLKMTTSLDASAAYVMPGVGNPSGAGISRDRERSLVQAGIPIVADEAYGELRFDGRAPPLLSSRAARVFHVGTFSKTLAPGLRIGWLVPPRDDRERVLRAKADADLQANSLSQAILIETLSAASFDYDSHLVRIRKEYARRAARLLRAVRKHLPFCDVGEPRGGFSLYVRTPLEGDDTKLLEAAVEVGVSFDPGSLFASNGHRGPIAFRLCHSSIAPGDMDEAARRLARAVASFRRARQV